MICQVDSDMFQIDYLTEISKPVLISEIIKKLETTFDKIIKVYYKGSLLGEDVIL